MRARREFVIARGDHREIHPAAKRSARVGTIQQTSSSTEVDSLKKKSWARRTIKKNQTRG